ncbi:receptor expression-enhancing protein 2 isoform X1 [Anopheles bellator]|uniref:receptor expression-enhancing protein 2 isoform X1 n=1 Tax=Anopheles bellator TaxID=139047 RepID=UPI002647DB5E|nr:receptor expression-enhancing protein 2 isoform X1 [Anopheles bellator]
MISAIVSRLVILLFGTLYPAYASYKAVRTKNVKEYVKWMMYWIVFAFFTCIETFTDILLSWFPFYYELKVIIVLWLLSPATRGSSTLYRKFVHPMLTRREQEIDDYINQAKEKGYTAVLQLGSKGVNYATNVIMQTAIKAFGGNSDPSSGQSMMRISQSDNSLLVTAAVVQTAAASIVGRSATSSTRDRPNVVDQHDGVPTEIYEGPQYETAAATLSRVRRSQSVDSALNRSEGGGIPRSATSRSVTRAGGGHQHSVIYELDTEEEEAERFLAAETAFLLQEDISSGTVPSPPRGRRAAASRAAATIAAAVEGDDSDGTESTASRRSTASKTSTKRTSQSATERTKKRHEPTGTRASAASTSTRTRKKVRKDSDSDMMDVE